MVLFYPVIPGKKFGSTVRIWPVRSTDTYTHDYLPPDNEGSLEFPAIDAEEFDAADAGLLAVCGILFFLLMGISKISYDLSKLFLIKKRSYLIRKCGRVSVYTNDRIDVPFSYWVPGAANIIVPTGLLGESVNYKICVLHELQHHRNGDTKWLYFVWVLKSVCVLNPFIHLWCRLISELQEFACDEVLVDRKKINSQDYARCLSRRQKYRQADDGRLYARRDSH